MKILGIAGLAVLGMLSLGTGVPSRATETRATIIYDEVATEIAAARVEDAELWVTTADLTRATGFSLKPQGVCKEELCFPLPKPRRTEFLSEDAGKTWFHLTAFAQLVGQPVARDAALSAWYFGLRSDQRQGLASLTAPNFALPDMSGKMHSLADFRGKKVLVVTWASW